MLVPKLRFKREDGTDYPEWEELSMSEIFTEIIEKNRPDLPVLSILQGKGTVYRDNSDRNIMYDKKSTGNYKAMRKGDFIIHLRTFEGGLECATLDGISSPAYKILRTDKLIPEAYKAYFRSKQFIEGRLAIAVTGVRDGKNIEMSTFWQILVPVPCLEEQQKIADFLSNVDEVIAQSEAEVANLQQQKKAAMQKIFSQEVRFKREDGTSYPEWEEKKLAYCFEERNTKQIPTDEAPLMAFIAYKGVADKGDRYDRSYLVKTDGKKYKRTEYNDFIYSSNNLDVGSIGLNKYGTAVISVVYQVFKVKDTAIPDFISALLQTPENMNKIIQYRQGCLYGQYKIYANDFLSVITAIPCPEEQQKIADFLATYDEAISCAKQELDKWKELKKGPASADVCMTKIPLPMW